VPKVREPQAEPREQPAPLPPFVGQRAVVDYFARTGADRLAQAYLLWGQRGVGKRTFARTLAMTLHCEHPTSFPLGYDGVCGACRREIAGSSGDTIYISEEFIREADRLAGKSVERKTDVMGIETSRRIISLMQMHSYEGGRMICIIPNFDFVTSDAVYNALLKELEEPNPGKLFVLTAERPDRVLPTIRSRTTSLRFDALSDKEIADTLVRQYRVDPKLASALAKRAQGSLGDALASLTDEGRKLADAAREWTLACIETPRRVPRMPELSKDNARVEIVEVLRGARLAVRDALVVALGSEGQLLDGETAPRYARVAQTLGDDAPKRLLAALSAVNEAARIADETNVPPTTVLGWLQVQLRST
jgi:effector-binding domain-containing protein